MVVAELSVVPLGTESTSVSEYVTAAWEELRGSGLKCSLGPMGTTVEGESLEAVYTAIARAQNAVFDLGAGRVYSVIKMDDRRDGSDRSMEDMQRSVQEES